MSKRKIWNTESGLNKLDTYFTKPADRTVFGRLASALHRNIQEEHLYGSTSTIRDERIAIVRHLNEFSLNILNISFNSLCLIEIDRDTQGISYEARLNRVVSFSLRGTSGSSTFGGGWSSPIMFGIIPNDDQVEDNQGTQLVGKGANFVGLAAVLTKKAF